MTTEYEKNDSEDQLNSNHVHTYFSQLNPIAERIAVAISDTKTTYGRLWYSMAKNEQDDILNETLIKPELTLQYIDSLAMKDSMHRLSIGDVHGTKDKDEAKELRKLFATANQQYYGFDGRSLSSFAIHRVAQKLLKDDGLADAGYRDEHSAPFSYRTRSQINFHLDNDADYLNKDNEFSLPVNTAKIINDLNSSNKVITTTSTKSQINTIKKPKRLAPIKPAQLTNTHLNVLEVANPKADLLAANFAMNTYSSYSPDQNEDQESSSLIPRQEDGALLSGSQTNNNTTLTDEYDEHEYYDEGNHEQMEEVKLLDAHVSLKRGFEFLNNW